MSTHAIRILTDPAGELLIDNAAMALLIGVPEADIRALPIIGGRNALPHAWVQRGRQRASEARTHTGSAAMRDSLRYWARKDHNAELEIVTGTTGPDR